MLDYSLFLFTKLWEAVMGRSDEPYDVLFEKISKVFSEYLSSPYNSNNRGEYECMMEFLDDYKESLPKCKAYIVRLEVSIRIVAKEDSYEDWMIQQATNKLSKFPDLIELLGQGLVSIEEDEEVPFGAIPSDKKVIGCD